jgi:esterase/lipase superfamily enzyme
MIIVTNRDINESNLNNGIGDHKLFGDKVNANGPNEVRLALATKTDNQWEVELLEEPEVVTEGNLPSKKVFNDLRNKLRNTNRNCVFFVHGFNQSFLKNLNKAYEIERIYDVEVVVFSWPSNPGGFKTKEYRHAKRNAQASIGALDATLEKISTYLQGPFVKEDLKACNTKFTLMTYSQGNYLFQNYIMNSIYDRETRMFDNIVLCQADVDNECHRN